MLVSEWSHGLSDYLDKIGTYPLLTAEQEGQFAGRMRAGRQAEMLLATDGGIDPGTRASLETCVERARRSRDELVQSNLRLVVWVASRYRGLGMSFLDLIQEGSIGLQVGVDRYDHTTGNRLSTFVVHWIKSSILRAVQRDAYGFHVPEGAARSVRELLSTEDNLQQDLGRSASASEIASRMGISLVHAGELRRAAKSPLSLEAPAAVLDGKSLADRVGDGHAARIDTRMEIEERTHEVAMALATLPVRERQVIQLRYGLDGTTPCSLIQVARRLGVTRERARQLESRAIRRMRNNSRTYANLAAYAVN